MADVVVKSGGSSDPARRYGCQDCGLLFWVPLDAPPCMAGNEPDQEHLSCPWCDSPATVVDQAEAGVGALPPERLLLWAGRALRMALAGYLAGAGEEPAARRALDLWRGAATDGDGEL